MKTQHVTPVYRELAAKIEKFLDDYNFEIDEMRIIYDHQTHQPVLTCTMTAEFPEGTKVDYQLDPELLKFQFNADEIPKKRVVSPTGAVHLVEWEEEEGADKGLVGLMCHYKPFGTGWLDGYVVDWPKTDKTVTCKSCLKALKRNRQ